ncbi:hypothetical protein, variant [Puccinia triticina 1-1 BBBD Race 1]|uniref:Uncharacterized protein n=1 Tax=Puccinia triticina (isolate 1-1 / race 1 (BBBD)) TaxID=630390 RepID=A0A180GQP5_PUCT1|nr:hypothetical protein, variant [Puccinia triticina 1-1 BBBD Race 1]
MGRSHRLGGFLGVVCKDKRATQRHVPRSLASSPTSSTIQTSTILRLKYLSQPHSFSTDRTAANMMLKAAWILVASLFIGKSAELAVPYTKQDPSSYDQYRPGGKRPIPWSGQPGSDSSSQNGTAQDAARKQGTPDETAEEPYKKGSYGSYQPQPAKKWAGDGSDLEGKPGAEDSGASGAWYPAPQNGTVASAEKKQPGSSSAAADDGRPWISHSPDGPSLKPYPGKNSTDCTKPGKRGPSAYQGNPYNATSRGWNGTESSATSRPGEKLEDPSKQPYSEAPGAGKDGAEDENEDEDDEGEDEDDEDEDDEDEDGAKDDDADRHGRSFVAPEPPVDGDAQSPTSKGPFGHNDDSHKLPQPIYHPVSSPKPTYPDSGY